MNNRVQLPIRTFESFGKTLENSNFHPVKILICHTGENLNGSVFSIDSFNKSINTLSNIPILAFVEKDDNGNKDFAGHEIDMDVFVDDDGKIKVREYYKEVPIGVIPETNNYFYEEIDGETYLGCYGYIWKSYSNDAYDILMEDEEKEVSMEIMIKECSYDNKNRCNIDKFEFLGITCLGSAYPAAMGRETTINMNFSANEELEFFQAVERLNKILKTQRKEDVVMDNIEEKDLLVEFAEEEEEKEVCPECGENPCICKEDEKEEEFTEEVEEEKEEFAVCPKCGQDPCECKQECSCEGECTCEHNHEEEFAEEEDKEEEEVCPECGKNPCECKDEEEEFAIEETLDFAEEVEEEEIEEVEEKEDFSLSYNNLYRAISISFDNITYQYTSFWGDTFDCRKYYLEDIIPSENIAIVYDDEDGQCYGVVYSMNNDDVVCNLESKVQYIKEWRPRVEGAKSFEIEDKDKVSVASVYEMIGEELHSLREYKHNIEVAEANETLRLEVEGILSTFSFDEEEVSELKEKALNREIDLEKFEDKLCVLEVKKMRSLKFSKQNIESNSLPITDMEEPKPTSKYQDLLDKYGRK